MKMTLLRLRVCLAPVIILAMLLTACGGSPMATVTPAVAPSPIVVKTSLPPQIMATDTALPGQGAPVLGNLLTNVAKLVPVHLECIAKVFTGEEVTEQFRWLADIDANGNRHLVFYAAEDGSQIELYVVGGIGYLGGENQFVQIEGTNLTGLEFVAMYGHGIMLAFNNVTAAKKLGQESANGFPADKYDAQFDASAMASLDWIAGGAPVDYQGTAWVEPQSGALVKATAEWKTAAPGATPVQSVQMTFDLTRADVAPIQAPNVD